MVFTCDPYSPVLLSLAGGFAPVLMQRPALHVLRREAPLFFHNPAVLSPRCWMLLRFAFLPGSPPARLFTTDLFFSSVPFSPAVHSHAFLRLDLSNHFFPPLTFGRYPGRRCRGCDCPVFCSARGFAEQLNGVLYTFTNYHTQIPN